MNCIRFFSKKESRLVVFALLKKSSLIIAKYRKSGFICENDCRKFRSVISWVDVWVYFCMLIKINDIFNAKASLHIFIDYLSLVTPSISCLLTCSYLNKSLPTI
jgi:hypothetical protein